MEPSPDERDMRADTGTAHVQGTWIIYERIETCYLTDFVCCGSWET